MIPRRVIDADPPIPSRAAPNTSEPPPPRSVMLTIGWFVILFLSIDAASRNVIGGWDVLVIATVALLILVGLNASMNRRAAP